MCPACFAAAAWAVAGTGSAGGLTFLVARKYRKPKRDASRPVVQNPSTTQTDERRQDRSEDR